MARNPNSQLKAAATPPAENLGRELSNAIVFFHEAIAAHLGMSAGEWKCYGLLKQHGPIAASGLAELSGFTTGAITGIADRLERAGYVRRQPNPGDRRSVILHPLQMGKIEERVAPVFASLENAMKGISRNYSQRELEAIADYFRRTIQALHEETLKLRKS